MSEVRPYTMTSPERLFALVNAVSYVVDNNIDGDIVECGVWRGGSMMAVIKRLQQMKRGDRELYLYDTFAGMTAPTEKDTTKFGPKTADETFREMQVQSGVNRWCLATLEEVTQNLSTTGYDQKKIHFIKGPVDKTLPLHMPGGDIALLRLDTDFYDSTKHELEHLFPRLRSGGVLIVDDYGHWEGQRAAVDEYFKAHGIRMLLNRIDYSARIGVKM
ncbi:MAG TPA: TylF/MycF/NovP-related O-methyltransferase [Candidatus Acidoferrum sp.]|nr:TylF/MycF/NovP-related O-methyltransferase [Candidatus Acidoferrum sp.]